MFIFKNLNEIIRQIFHFFENNATKSIAVGDLMFLGMQDFDFTQI